MLTTSPAMLLAPTRWRAT